MHVNATGMCACVRACGVWCNICDACMRTHHKIRLRRDKLNNTTPNKQCILMTQQNDLAEQLCIIISPRVNIL